MTDPTNIPSISLTFLPTGWAVQAHVAGTLFYVAAINEYAPEKIKLVPFAANEQWVHAFELGDLFHHAGNYYKVTRMAAGNSPHVLLERTAAPNKETVDQKSMF